MGKIIFQYSKSHVYAHAYVHRRDVAKQAKIEAREEQETLKDFYGQEKGIVYGPGIAD